VVVSGAGPSGCHAAYHCARSGLKTLVLERQELPRVKCCAGGVLQRALGKLGSEVPESLIESEIRGFTVVREDFRKHFPLPDRAGITVRRSEFDQFLARMAEREGAELWTGGGVRAVKERPDKVVVATKSDVVEARYLVAADGVTGMAASIDLKRDPGDSIEIHLIDTPTKNIRWGGFPVNGWMFPRRSGGSIGVVGRSDGGRLKRLAWGIAGEVSARYGQVGEPSFCSHSLPMAPRRRLSSERCVAVGDAAGFVNQITGEGLSYALESGRLAAMTIARSVERGKGLRSYERRCAASILPDLKATMALGPLLHWMVGVVDTQRFLRNFGERRELIDICLSIARGNLSWTSLLASTIFRFPGLFFSSL
jgi:geranylgeranyl reductase family protein